MSDCKICNLNLTVGEEYTLAMNTYNCDGCHVVSKDLPPKDAIYQGIEGNSHCFLFLEEMVCPVCDKKSWKGYIFCDKSDGGDNKDDGLKIPFQPISDLELEILFGINQPIEIFFPERADKAQ